MRFRIGITKEMQVSSSVFTQGLFNTDEYKALLKKVRDEKGDVGWMVASECDPAAFMTWYSGELPDWPESSAFITLLQSIARGFR
jgi:hypothetical protein